MPKNAQTTAHLHSSHMLARRKWHPTPVFVPGESQGWGRLVGSHLWGHTESDTTEAAAAPHASKVMLKILQARLLECVNCTPPDVQAGFRKGRGSEIKLPTSAGSWKKEESYRKNIYFCFTDYDKSTDCVDHSKLWKILQERRIPDHLTCFLRNL